MHIGKAYRLSSFLYWTRRDLYLLVILASVPVVMYEVCGWKWAVLPWTVVSLLGTATAFIVGFKNTQTYNRTRDAQAVWTSIATTSNLWGIMCRDYFRDPAIARNLIYRHFAWLTALRYQLRGERVWEVADMQHNAEYQRYYTIHERTCDLDGELAKYISVDERAKLTAVRSKTTQLLAMQSAAVKAAYGAEAVLPAQFIELQRTLNTFFAQQAQSESIKDTPYPRQYSIINTIFVRVFCVLLPFGLLQGFDELNRSTPGLMHGFMVWLLVPFCVIITWMYTSLVQVGESTENPFEGSANDVPITQICRAIEIDLREMLGEKELPPVILPENDIIL
ncbi:bestrophin family protein [Chitinophaga sp.]|uniref:bestrophin family protein n=1 Tax=Chitinophaga sp. TaxID=1869181 RepID=UPI0026250C04|nr:bestrophin family ion channel [uncultured Chitinophaga sp.]